MSRKTSSSEQSLKGTPTDFNGLYEKFKISLMEAFESKDVKILRQTFDSYKFNNDADKKSPLDQNFRELLLFELSEDIEKVGQLITLSVDAAREEIVSVTIPVVLLGDIFDAVTLDKCEKIFNFVEDKVNVWKEDIFFTSCKNNILRMCNDLLRRLSRAQNTVFCGRILLFLAKFFPFSERSGLNIISEFNLDNVTEFGVDGKDLDEALEDTIEDVPVKIDYNLYCKFWSLQDFFRNPNQCYSKVQWKMFQTHATNVLAAFSSFKLEEPRTSPSSKEETKDMVPQDMKMEVDETVRKAENFFAKFLTNPKLLALQLSDSNFRRSVLVQFLILFQYLQLTVKFKTDSLTLTSSQSEFIKETEAKVYKLIGETPPNGKKFAKTVEHMLQREEMWNNWKNDGCKEFKKPDSNEEGYKPPSKRQKKSLGDNIKEANRQGKFFLGNDVLTKLWNVSPDNLQACKSEDRNFLPPVDTYIENPREKNDPSFEWRALRLLARQSPHFFTSVNAPSYKIADYLESVRKKIQKEKHEINKVGGQPENTTESTVEVPEQEQVALETVTEESELLKPEPMLVQDDKNTHKTITASKENIEELSPKIGTDWKKLGKKLGYTADEMLYFETENPNATDACKVMLTLWFEDDDDASLDNLAYILEGLEMHGAAEAVKTIIDPPNKMEDISD
ncbi:THO complex subunit 1 [Episyrphus balteatus]|uniref:THO complex subunit 1 n=1 Tax=Episyrphus balteatus TaxID=286459 RepID=UPI00248687CE|nr:THO complex subunit 1 [Episyrphus balteatus]